MRNATVVRLIAVIRGRDVWIEAEIASIPSSEAGRLSEIAVDSLVKVDACEVNEGVVIDVVCEKSISFSSGTSYLSSNSISSSS